MNEVVMGRIISSVKGSMDIEGIVASNYALNVGRLYLQEIISADLAIEMIREKFLGGRNIGMYIDK